MRIRARAFSVFHIILALAGMAILAISTRYGTGIGGDATIYITSAQNVLAGRGLGLVGPAGEFRLIPYFPPFFPLMLSIFGLFGFNLVSAAYWLNLIMFGGIIWLSGHTILQATRSTLLSILTAVLVLVSPVLLPVFSWAMSEPLCIFLGFSGLASVDSYLSGQHKLQWLIISSITCGLSFLTRYSAIAFVAAGAAGLLLLDNSSWRKKISTTILYLIIASIPMTIWISYDLLHTTTISSRSILTWSEVAKRAINLWPQLNEVLLFWLIPDSWIKSPPYPIFLNNLLILLSCFLLISWIIYITRLVKFSSNGRENLNPPGNHKSLCTSTLLIFFSIAYLGVTILVYLTTYPPITIGYRMYSPLHLAVLWLIPLLGTISRNLGLTSRWLKPVLLACLIVSTGWYGWRSTRIVIQNYQYGIGYLSPTWQQSPTIRAVKELPADQPIVTNEEMALLFLTGRTSYPLAEIYFDKPLTSFTRYGDGNLSDDQAQSVFRNHSAALVLFNSIETQLGGLYGYQTSERINKLTAGLNKSFTGIDGSIYYYTIIRSKP